MREIGWFTALAMVLSAVIGAGINGFAVTAYGWSMSGNSVSPLAMVFFAAIPFFCSAVCLGIMSSAMPRSGGPYVIMSRAVNPMTGFLASWGSWVSIALSVGLLAQYDIFFWGSSFMVTGAVTNNATAAELGKFLYWADSPTWFLAGPWPSIWVGIILVIIIAVFALLGYKVWGRVVQALFIIPLIGTLFTLVVLFMHTAGDFAGYWDALFGGTASWGTIMGSSMPYTPDFVASFAALPGIIFAFTAFYASSYVGGEVKNPKRNMVLSLVGGMILIIVVYVLYTGGLARAVGEDFLFGYNMGGYGSSVAPAILPFFAAVYAYGIPALAVFISITGAIWLLNDLPPFFAIATRSTFAWSFDRQFPEKFAEVSDRFHTPIWSVLLVLPIAIFAVFLSGLTAWGSLYYITIIDCFTYLFICVAALTFTKKFKSAYDRSAKFDFQGKTSDFVSVGFLVCILGFVLGTLMVISSASSRALGIFFIIPSLVVAFMLAIYAYLNEDKMYKDTKVSALGVFGWIGLFFWIFMIGALLFYIFTIDPAYALTYYGMPDAQWWESFMILFTFGIGALIYLAYKYRNKRRGIDISETYGEIPPE